MAVDFNNLVWQRNNTRSSYYARRQEIDTLNGKIDRLKVAKDAIDGYKNEFKKNQKKDRETLDKKIQWKGDNYNKYCSIGEKMKESNNAYYNKIDSIINEINKEIRNIRSQINSKQSWADRLWTQLQSIQRQINSFYN